MSIEVTCPNGHSMRVKTEFAGKSGLCPYCKARIAVPDMSTIRVASGSTGLSEDELLAVLGPPRPAPRTVVAEAPPHQVAKPAQAQAGVPPPHWPQSPQPETSDPHDEPVKESSANPLGAAFVHRRRVCPKCCEIVPFASKECPHCHTSLSGWSFPLPDESGGQEGRKAMCHYLGLRKQGEVMIVRFGEHSILDEACVKKFADELFQVADRADCQNVLLNFTGVVGLSSAMLGVMLMLRKKISQKRGKLKLCLVGPEIMDIFHATKLGQIFDILGTEQQGLRAFG
jgi:anti-anti-sigma factor